jgi:hypothetical protein
MSTRRGAAPGGSAILPAITVHDFLALAFSKRGKLFIGEGVPDCWVATIASSGSATADAWWALTATNHGMKVFMLTFVARTKNKKETTSLLIQLRTRNRQKTR